MNYFEYLAVGFCLSVSPKMLYNKKFREERKYILNEVKCGRGILDALHSIKEKEVK